MRDNIYVAMNNSREEESDDELMEMVSLFLITRRKRLRGNEKKKLPRRKPRFWIRSIFQLRSEFGEYHRLIKELRECDREYFFR